MALFHLLQDENIFVDKLLTTVNAHHQRVSMHGLRVELMERQLAQLNIPPQVLQLPEQPTMDEYDALMKESILNLKQEGFTHSAFGDIFLKDLRSYREKQLADLGMHAIFPLWKRDTSELIEEFIDLGFKAVVICVKGELLGNDFVGTGIDKNFLSSLPPGVDPCGENGEFHTFCYDGPIFNEPIQFKKGEKTFREYENPSGEGKTGFWFLDLV